MTFALIKPDLWISHIRLTHKLSVTSMHSQSITRRSQTPQTKRLKVGVVRRPFRAALIVPFNDGRLEPHPNQLQHLTIHDPHLQALHQLVVRNRIALSTGIRGPLQICVIVYNDLDGRITRLFRVLRDNGEELQKRLSLTPYSEIEFRNALEEHPDEIEQARRDFVRWRLSIGGRGDSSSFTLHRVRRQMADVVSGYLSMIDEQLPFIMDRLRTVQFTSRPAIDVIRKWDRSDTLIYCDPPYVPETTRGSVTLFL